MRCATSQGPVRRWDVAGRAPQWFCSRCCSRVPFGSRGPPACAAEQEPNDDPAAANPIADAACVDGALDGSDKDAFAWTVSQASARQRWTLELEGAPNQKTVVGIFRLDVDGAGDDEPTGVDELATFEDRPGSAPLRVEDLLLRPGTYHLQVAGSDEETYRLRLSAGAPLPTPSEQEPNDEDEAGNPVVGAVTLSGDLADSDDWFAWTLSEADARQRWQLTAQSPLGEEVRLDLYTADGEALGDIAAGQTGRARLYDLGLDAGTYLVKVGPEKDGPTPYALEAIPLGERTDGREEEPNDDPATADPIAPGQQVTGRLAGDQEADFYRLAVDPTLAGQRFDVTLTTAAGASRRLCLLDGAGTELQCREGEGSTALAGLTLA